MKRLLGFPVRRFSALRLPPSAFTLVEMLVVITIIGILASMVTAAAIVARRRAKIAAVVMEVKQLEMACQAYKEKFGEYPPDFYGVDLPPPVGLAARNAVLRHLARAFPRYQPAGGWGGFAADVQNGWGIDVSDCTPANALVFWLGGQPDWVSGGTTPVKGFLGFAADPQKPFQSAATSRIAPFFDFDPTRVAKITSSNGGPYLAYWPRDAYGNKTSGAIVYFRAENGTYRVAGGGVKLFEDAGDPGTPQGIVFPAGDTRLNFPTSVEAWVNPRSFQIFSSGLDVKYGVPSPATGLQFPTGGNYQPQTFDDITNFSGGTLEDAMP